MTRQDTSWDKVAGWYDKHVCEASDHHRDVIIPETLKLLDPKAGEKILDVGCGQGALCRELARDGVQAVGIDASKKLIDLAKKRSGEKYNIHYRVADAGKLDGIQDGTFDAACSVLAVQNMDNLEAAAKEMSRVVKSGGRLLWVLNHPCFRIPRQSGWGFDEKRKLQYRRVDRYMTEIKIPIQMHPGAAPGVHTWTFHKPLSAYFYQLNSFGFVVTKLEEWVSQRKSKPGGKARAENMARAEIPLFLAILAVRK
ncbi:MAG: methyltransferase domain-containing protein [bacterium]